MTEKLQISQADRVWKMVSRWYKYHQRKSGKINEPVSTCYSKYGLRIVALFILFVNAPAWSDVVLQLGDNDPAKAINSTITEVSFTQNDQATLYQAPKNTNGVRIGVDSDLPDKVTQPKMKGYENFVDSEGWRVVTTKDLEECGLGISFKFNKHWTASGPGNPNSILTARDSDNTKDKDLYYSLWGATDNPKETPPKAHTLTWSGYASLVKIRQIDTYQKCHVETASIPTAVVACYAGLDPGQYKAITDRNNLLGIHEPTSQWNWNCHGKDSAAFYKRGPNIIIPEGWVYVLANVQCKLFVTPSTTTNFGILSTNQVESANVGSVITTGTAMTVMMPCKPKDHPLPIQITMSYSNPVGTEKGKELGQSTPPGPAAVAIGLTQPDKGSSVGDGWAIGEIPVTKGADGNILTTDTRITLYPALIRQEAKKIDAGSKTITATLSATVY